MTAIQFHAPVPVSGLSHTDPQRTRFDAFKRRPRRFWRFNMALGLVLLSWYVRE